MQRRFFLTILLLCLMAIVPFSHAQDTFVDVTDVVGGVYHLPLSNCPTQGLTYTRSTNAFGCVSGSSAPAAGSNTQVQFNDSGVLGGDAGFTYVKATDTATIGALVLTTALPATSGGTGFASYTVGDLLYASTTTALSKLTDVAAGSYLRSGGAATAPVWSTTTLPNSATTGDLLYASATSVYSNLADVATGSILVSGGAATAPAWSSTPTINGATILASTAGGVNIGAIDNTAGQPQVTAPLGNLVMASNTTVRLRMVGAPSSSANLQSYLARGTLAAPTVSSSGDGLAITSNTFDSAVYTPNSAISMAASGTQSAGSTPGAMVLSTTPSGAAATVARITISSAGNVGIGTASFGTSAATVLALGASTAPTTSPADVVQLWEADRGGTAGKGALNLRTEDGTSHIFGDLVGIGTLTPGALLHVAETSTSAVRGILSAQYSASTDGGRVIGRKARGTLAAPTIITTGDTLASWIAEGYDGSNYLQMGAILMNSTGTVAVTRVPTTMVFQTATDAAPSVLTTALTLNANQSATFAAGITATTVAGTGVFTPISATAVTAGGALAVTLGSSAPGIYVGSGAPTISAAKGSLYIRSDGSGVADRAYINTNGSTTWTAIATAG